MIGLYGILLLLLLFIYYAEAAKNTRTKRHKAHTKKQYTIHKCNKTIKSIKHVHIIAAKTFPKIFVDQIFRRRNEIALTVDFILHDEKNSCRAEAFSLSVSAVCCFLLPRVVLLFKIANMDSTVCLPIYILPKLFWVRFTFLKDFFLLLM